VYHAHSDFSISAIHWVGSRDSRVLQSYNAGTGQLETSHEAYIEDGETAPLVDRTVDGKGTSQLRLCTKKSPYVSV